MAEKDIDRETRPKVLLEIELTGDLETRRKIVRRGHEHDWASKQVAVGEDELLEWIVFCKGCGVKSFD